MMYITTRDGRSLSWHVGDPVPIIDTRVISLQVDCTELEWFVQCMKDTRNTSRPSVTGEESLSWGYNPLKDGANNT